MSQLHICWYFDHWGFLLRLTSILPREGVRCDWISPIHLIWETGQPLSFPVVLSWILDTGKTELWHHPAQIQTVMLLAQNLSFLCGPLKSASVHVWVLKHSHRDVPKQATCTECMYHQPRGALGAYSIIPLDFGRTKAFWSWFASYRKQFELHSSPFPQTLALWVYNCVCGTEIQAVSLKGFFHAE